MAKNTTIEFSSLQRDVLKTLGVDSIGLQKSKKKISLDFVEQTFSHKEKTLAKSILNVLDGPDGSIERLAFEVIPEQSQYGCLWVQKQYLLPDDILKRVSIQDSLIAAIVNTRSNQIAAFGRPQPDRFSTGMRIEPEPHYSAKLDVEGKKKLQERIAEVEALVLTCGNTKGWKDENALGLSQFLFQITRNAVVFGRIAVEIIWVDGPGGTKFHSFRPIDAGTIYKTRPFQDQAESVRQQAKILLEQVNNKELNAERYVANDYVWVQVINGRPSQVFTGDECLCHNFYPVPDVELNGYPVTPLDTVISDVTMHINIVKHNAKYFESGRAARGMLVIKSDDADENVVGYVRQQFHASINGTGNAWRMPVFGVGVNEEVSWQPIDNSSRDMEFQYLSDTNSRVILSAFQMSPEELPGYAHLSRGTNSQSLSETNNEFVLEGHRDVGIRPLLAQIQNFFNAKILPLVAPDLAKFCSLKFVGLDVDTAEKESTRLQQDMAVHMSYDEVREKVEKDPIGREWGGQFPLNPQIQSVLDKYMLVGDIKAHFFGDVKAKDDPRFQFVANPLWFQWQQLLMQQQQMQAQAQQMQVQQPQGQTQQGPQDQPQSQQGPQDQPQDQGSQDQQNQSQSPQESQSQPEDLSRSADQLATALGKSTSNKTPWTKKALLHHQRALVTKVIEGFERDAEEATKSITKIVEEHLPRR